MEYFKKILEEEIKKNDYFKEEKIILEKPKNNYGDYSINTFILAKKYKKNPIIIAEEIKKSLEENKKLKENFEITQINAFLNFTTKKEKIIEYYNSIKEKKELTKIKNHNLERKKIVVEYPSPNTNKPLHLGHVRNMSLGNSISKILEHNEKKVYKVNLNNDRGIAIAKAVLMYKKEGEKTPEEEGLKEDYFVGKYYVMFEKKYHELKQKKPEEAEKLLEEAYELLRNYENKEEETLKLFEKFNSWALKGHKKTYEEYNVKHDKEYYESKIYEEGKKIVLEYYKKGIFKKDDKGNIIADLKQYNLGEKVLLRKDGTSIYITQDIALAFKKHEDFKADKYIFVVGNEQEYHFKVLFKILELIGFKKVEDNIHLSYGMVFLPEGRMKSREGKVVEADEILEEVKSLSKKELEKRYNLKEEELEYRSKIIALSAIKYFMLKINPKLDFTFNPKESLSFEGETGPYLLYTYARIKSILRKKKEKENKIKEEENVNEDKKEYNYNDEEIKIIKKILEFETKSYEAAEKYKPNIIANYILELAQMFNEYYHKNKILHENKKILEKRTKLSEDVSIIIKKGLELLDIQTLEEM